MPLYRRLPKRGFKCRNSKTIIGINLSALEAFEDGAVVIEDMASGEKKTLKCDDAVIAFGTKSDNKLLDMLEEKFNEVTVIGDAATPDTITSAIHDGFFAALNI